MLGSRPEIDRDIFADERLLIGVAGDKLTAATISFSLRYVFGKAEAAAPVAVEARPSLMESFDACFGLLWPLLCTIGKCSTRTVSGVSGTFIVL